MAYTIAIDGPAASGKSTIAKLLADKLNYIYVDTGAMYRAITYKAIKNNISVSSEDALVELLKSTTIDITADKRVLLDGLDVSNDIRSQEVTKNVSEVASFLNVRKELVKRQQLMSEGKSVVMDGRDIGTVVFPNADLKIFMVASSEIRAKRRFIENQKLGVDTPLAELIKEIEERDKFDSEREYSPLKKADDAYLIDTSHLTIDEVVNKIIQLVK